MKSDHMQQTTTLVKNKHSTNKYNERTPTVCDVYIQQNNIF